jgi:uncharacterized protein YqeY
MGYNATGGASGKLVMTFRDRLDQDLKAAMRSHADKRRDTLRSLLAAIKQEEVDTQQQASDEMTMAVLRRQAKQRHETIADAERAGREDLVREAHEELAIIEDYLPQRMSREEIREHALEVIGELGVSDMSGMGRVMGRLMPRLQDRADGRDVSAVVRDLLRQ